MPKFQKRMGRDVSTHVFWISNACTLVLIGFQLFNQYLIEHEIVLFNYRYRTDFVPILLIGFFVSTWIYYMMAYFSTKDLLNSAAYRLVLSLLSVALIVYMLLNTSLVNYVFDPMSVSNLMDVFSLIIFGLVGISTLMMMGIRISKFIKYSTIALVVFSLVFFAADEASEAFFTMLRLLIRILYLGLIFGEVLKTLSRAEPEDGRPTHGKRRSGRLQALLNYFSYRDNGNLFFSFCFVSLFAVADLIFYICGSQLGLANYACVVFFSNAFMVSTHSISVTYAMAQRVNDELRYEKENLEDIVRERTKDLEEQTRRAIAANDAKSKFLANMSHEIRTPMNAILGISEIQLSDDLPPSTRADLERIHNSGATLLGIINDILDMSKIESGALELVPLKYESVSFINDVIQLNIVRIASKPIEFKIAIDGDFPAFLMGDELRVKQIMNNLLSNAFKYTKEGTVTMRFAGRVEGDTVWMTFVVEDTGIGIRKKDIAKLFSDYSQFDKEANRKIEGTGLGLSITNQLVLMMGGTIEVESEYGKGSTFTVHIKQGKVDERVIGQANADNLMSFNFISARQTDGRNLVRTRMPYGKVLLVDDVETNLYVAAGLMRPYSLVVDTALSGEEAVEKVRSGKTQYNIIFMDHMMPKMDGMEATKLIREIGTDYAKSVPIVALTANAIIGNENMFLENGFDSYISKPIDVMRLDVILNQFIHARQPEEIRKKYESTATAPREAEKPPFEIEDVDTAVGVERCGGSASNYRKLLSIFYQDAQKGILTIQDALKNNNMSLFTTTAHALKSASANVGAARVSQRAKDLETTSKNYQVPENLTYVIKKTPVFVEEMEMLLKRIAAVLEIEQDEDVRRMSYEETVMLFRELLEKVVASAGEYDFEALSKHSDSLLKLDLTKKFRTGVQMVSDHIIRGEYEEAAELAKDILNRGATWNPAT